MKAKAGSRAPQHFSKASHPGAFAPCACQALMFISQHRFRQRQSSADGTCAGAFPVPVWCVRRAQNVILVGPTAAFPTYVYKTVKRSPACFQGFYFIKVMHDVTKGPDNLTGLCKAPWRPLTTSPGPLPGDSSLAASFVACVSWTHQFGNISRPLSKKGGCGSELPASHRPRPHLRVVNLLLLVSHPAVPQLDSVSFRLSLLT